MQKKYEGSIKWRKLGSDHFFEIELAEKVEKKSKWYTLHVLRYRGKNYDFLLMITRYRKEIETARADIFMSSVAKGLNQLMRPRFDIVWITGEAPVPVKRRFAKRLSAREREVLQNRTRAELEKQKLEVQRIREERLLLEAQERRAKSNAAKGGMQRYIKAGAKRAEEHRAAQEKGPPSRRGARMSDV